MTTIDTTVSSLRQCIDDASSALDVYKSPDIDEALERINALLIAAHLGSIEHDHVARIEQRKNHYEIHTEWSARGCAQTSEYALPYIIVDAHDPIVAAVTWARAQAMDKAQRSINKAQLDLRYAQEQYDKACAMPT